MLDQDYWAMRRTARYKHRAERRPFFTFWIEPFWRTWIRVIGILVALAILTHWVGFL